MYNMYKTFTLKSSLKMHLKVFHEGCKDFGCEACRKTSRDMDDLKKHISSVHEARKDFECHACKKKF